MNQRIIAIINQKGGVGKTTTAINVASELAKITPNVLLIDLDTQGNATSGLGVDHHAQILTSADVILARNSLPEAVVKVADGLDLLPGGQSLVGLEQMVGKQTAPNQLLKQSLVDSDYNYVILDCPPSFGFTAINALVAATDLIIPVQAEYYALEGLGQLLGVVDRIKDSDNHGLNILGVIITIFDKRTTLAKDVKKQLVTSFGDKVFKITIPRNVRLAEAPSHGMPINKFDKSSKGAKAYRLLTKEIVDRL